MAIVQQISLNMIPQNVPVIVPVNQYDTVTGSSYKRIITFNVGIKEDE